MFFLQDKLLLVTFQNLSTAGIQQTGSDLDHQNCFWSFGISASRGFHKVPLCILTKQCIQQVLALGPWSITEFQF